MPVAITGIGLMVSKFNDAKSLFDALSAGGSVIRFDKTMEDLGLPGVPSGAILEDQLRAVTCEETSPAGILLSYSFSQAMDKAGFGGTLPPRCGVYVGINKNLVSPRYIFDVNSAARADSFKENDIRDVPNLVNLNPRQVVNPILDKFGFPDEVQVHSDACTAGASAIVSGYRRIQRGDIDVALCGASEQGAHPIMQMMFSRIGALCKSTFAHAEQASRPFDKDRAGCILADASAMVVLEDFEKAKSRGANILGFIAGASRESEAFRLTSSSPDGSLYAKCMTKALKNAGITSDKVDHISAHGTATHSNDAAESRAINTVFGSRPSVTSTKSALGHSLAVSGVLEVALSTLCFEHQTVLPTLNFKESLDNEPSINIISQSRPEKLDYILSNSFGFGGQNASIVLARNPYER